jgi:hypothetical protein
MNRKKLEKIRSEVSGLRRSQPKAKDLEAIAKALGRKEVKRGKEPTFASEAFPSLRPLSIPSHKGRDLSTGVKHSILSQLEEDIATWDEFISQQEREHDNGNNSGSE